MKTHHHYCSRLFLTAVLTGSCFLFVGADELPAQTPKPAAPAVDPATHAAHVAAGKMPATPADVGKGDPALSQDVSQLQAKIAQLEAALAKNAPQQTTAGAMPGMGGPPSGKGGGPPSGAGPAMAGMGGPPSGAGPAMAGMGGPPSGAGPAMAGMGGGGGGMNMMGMMDKMMGMMDKMMGMGGGTMPAGAPMPGGGGMGMMAMDKMEMAGMMGMGGMGGAAPRAMPQSVLPGFPGATHLYHLGATGFFLDHPQHIALTTEQQAALNKAREQALLAKSTADRAKEQAEQELWTLTAADQPDAAKIEGKLAEIGKLSSDERLAFIRAVGEASKLLTDEQRKILTGFAPPAPAAPAAAPMAPMAPMKDM